MNLAIFGISHYGGHICFTNTSCFYTGTESLCLNLSCYYMYFDMNQLNVCFKYKKNYANHFTQSDLPKTTWGVSSILEEQISAKIPLFCIFMCFTFLHYVLQSDKIWFGNQCVHQVYTDIVHRLYITQTTMTMLFLLVES